MAVVNNIKATQADALSVLAAPVNPNDVVRQTDLESSLNYYATSQQVAALQSSIPAGRPNSPPWMSQSPSPSPRLEITRFR